MDGVSNAIAIVSLAIQVADSTKKLVEIWKEMRDAPSDVKRQLQHLHTLAMAISVWECDECEDEISQYALRDCQEELSFARDKLDSLATDLDATNAARRKWGAVKAVFKKQELLAVMGSLDRVKMTLLISEVSSLKRYLRADIIVRTEDHQGINSEDTAKMLSGFVHKSHPEDESLPKIKYSTPELESTTQQAGRSAIEQCSMVIRTRFAALRVVSLKRNTDSMHHSQSRVSVIQEYRYEVTPSHFLWFLGITKGFQFEIKYRNGPQYSLKPFNVVRPDALVFQFCKDGNLRALRTLLDRGDASITDMTPGGLTLLHYAVKYLQIDVARFLLDQDAETMFSHFDKLDHPLSYRRIKSQDEISTRELSMIQLLYDKDPYDLGAWALEGALEHAIIFYRPNRPLKYLLMKQEARREAVSEIIRKLLPYLPTNDPDMWAKLLSLMIGLCHEQQHLTWFLQRSPCLPDDCEHIWGGHPVVRAMRMKLPFRDPLSMKYLAQKTLDFHCIYAKSSSSPFTLTSLAMRQPRMFFPWRDILFELNVDIDVFVQKELELDGSPLAREGWDQVTLVALFRSNVFPDSVYSISGFVRCGRCDGHEQRSGIMFDLPWRRHLRNLRGSRSHTSCCAAMKCSQVILKPPLHVREANMFEQDGYSVEDPALLADNDPSLYRDISESIKSTLPPRLDALGSEIPWPYVVVCGQGCEDGICVGTAYDSDAQKEPDLPPYIQEPPKTEDFEPSNSSIVEDRCPSMKMPGAFVA